MYNKKQHQIEAYNKREQQTKILEEKFPHITVDPNEDLNINHMIEATFKKVYTDPRFNSVHKRAAALGISERNYYRFQQLFFPQNINYTKCTKTKPKKQKKSLILTSISRISKTPHIMVQEMS